MNRDISPAPQARNAPATIGRSASRAMESSPIGYALLVALFAAAIVWSPAAGDLSLTVFITGLSSTALALVETTRASRRGPSTMTRGRKLALLITIGGIVVAAASASVWASAVGQPQYGLALAVITAAVVFIGAWRSERTDLVAHTEGH